MKKIKIILSVEGMTCAHCELSIEEGLSEIKGVEKVDVSFNTGKVTIIYDEEKVNLDSIKDVIRDLGYEPGELEEKGSDKRLGKDKEEDSEEGKGQAGNKDSGKSLGQAKINTEALYILIIILGGYVILKEFGLLNFTNYFPQIQSTMGYGMLFVIGVLTSLHCVAMCGGINLAQSVNSIKHGGSTVVPNLLYNLGRVVSYTIIGGIAGALGSVVSIGGGFRGAVAIFAGVFMVIMGLNMLNIFPWLRRFNLKMPKFLGRRISNEKKKNHSSFYVGLLNGLMPCGPLQSMQLYALSTGSFGAGALSMFLFSLGTVPLLFGLGTLSSKLNKKFTAKMMTVCAVLVVVLGFGMLNNGLALSGIVVSKDGGGSSAMNTAQVHGDYQLITTNLEFGSYPSIEVKAGVPVKWTINAEKGKVNSCNNEIIIPKYGIDAKIVEGENIIEFTPEESGEFGYSCWMGMIRGSIVVEK